MRSKIKLVLVISCILLLSGCNNNEIEKNYNTSGMKHISCKRDATESDKNTKVSINYDLYYKGDYLKVLKSVEEVVSSNEDLLNSYEKAYKKVFSAYDNLEYYYNDVSRDEDSVRSVTYINYGKIDMDKLMDIEGSDNNVTVTNGKIKLSDWKEFAKKYGTVCEE